MRYKSILFSFLLLLAVSSSLFLDPATAEEIKYVPVPETIINDGVPSIPVEIQKKMEQYNDLKSAFFVDWDPRGQGMIITTRLGNTSQLYWLDKPMSEFKQLTDYSEPVSRAKFSPSIDKKYFVFTRDAGGAENYQFYRYDLNSKNAQLITDGKSRNESYLFKNSGNKIAYVNNSRTGQFFDIYTMDPEKPEATKMVYESGLGYYNPTAWFEDNKRLLIVKYLSINEASSFILDTETGKVKDITPKSDEMFFFAVLFVTKDGKYGYGISDIGSEYKKLIKINLETLEVEVITGDIDWDVEDIVPDEELTRAVFKANINGIYRVYLMDLKTDKYKQIEAIPAGEVNIGDFDKSGNIIALTLNNAKMNGDVFHYDINKSQLVRWTQSDTAGLDTSKFIEPELIQYPTFDKVDGKSRMIPCFYYKPENRSGKALPVLIYIHGGPEGQFTPSFDPSLGYVVNELGISVLAPNVRGSSGYGKTYLLLDNAEKREDSVKDIGSLIDWIATRPELDKDKIAVFGGSYGGYMVLASMFHYNNKLACGIDYVGISNFVTFLKNTADYRRDQRRAEYGDERKIGELLNKISPTTNAHLIKKPLFVVQGKNDPRVPATEAEQIVKVVRENNIPVWYQIAVNEGHGFRKKDNRDYLYYSIIRFLQEYLIK